ncbi:iron ABC transporter permease [Nocardioides sp. Soil797]|nr:iron ABC transporter permease [Nocardioides sp. Soil797]
MTLTATASDRVATLGRTRLATGTAILIAALVVVAVCSMLIGSVTISPAAVFDAAHPDHGIAESRWPRTFLGLAVGAALGLAGACMQGLTRNPLADPGILGVNAGAAFAMVLAIAWFGVSDLSGRLWFAFAGAAVAAVLVHAIASLGRDGATPMKLTIAGAALSAALTSWVSAVLLTDRATFDVFRFWQVGTLGGRDFDVLLTGLPFLVAGAVLAVVGSRLLNLLALGDDLARGLGRRVVLDRVVLGLAIVLLAGTATALAGPIAFVGLVIPHLVRSIVGSDYRRIIPFSAGYGAVLTTAADVVGRVVLPPTEVQVGIMTAVLGVPVFLWMIGRRRMGGI